VEQTQQELFATGEPQGERPPKVPIGPRVRVMLVRETGPLYPKPVTTSTDICKLVRSEVETWHRERFLTVLLKGKRCIWGLDEVSVGSLTTFLVHLSMPVEKWTIENAQAIAAHESPRTTKLYDRTSDEITLDEIERISI